MARETLTQDSRLRRSWSIPLHWNMHGQTKSMKQRRRRKMEQTRESRCGQLAEAFPRDWNSESRLKNNACQGAVLRQRLPANQPTNHLTRANGGPAAELANKQTSRQARQTTGTSRYRPSEWPRGIMWVIARSISGILHRAPLVAMSVAPYCSQKEEFPMEGGMLHKSKRKLRSAEELQVRAKSRQELRRSPELNLCSSMHSVISDGPEKMKCGRKRATAKRALEPEYWDATAALTR